MASFGKSSLPIAPKPLPYYQRIADPHVGGKVQAGSQKYGTYTLNRYTGTSASVRDQFYKAQIDAIDAKVAALYAKYKPAIRNVNGYDDYSQYSFNLLNKPGNPFPTLNMKDPDKWGVPFYTWRPIGARGAIPPLYGLKMPDGTPGTTPAEDALFETIAKNFQDCNVEEMTWYTIDQQVPEIRSQPVPPDAFVGLPKLTSFSKPHYDAVLKNREAIKGYTDFRKKMVEKYPGHFKWQADVLNSPQIKQLNQTFIKLWEIEKNAEFKRWLFDAISQADKWWADLGKSQPAIFRGFTSALGGDVFSGGLSGVWNRMDKTIKNLPYTIAATAAAVITAGVLAPAVASATGISAGAVTAAAGAVTKAGVDASFGKSVDAGSVIASGAGAAGEATGSAFASDVVTDVGKGLSGNLGIGDIVQTGKDSGVSLGVDTNLNLGGNGSMSGLTDFINNPLGSISSTPLGNIVTDITKGDISGALSSIAGQAAALTPAQIANVVAPPSTPVSTATPTAKTPVSPTVVKAAVPIGAILLVVAVLLLSKKG